MNNCESESKSVYQSPPEMNTRDYPEWFRQAVHW